MISTKKPSRTFSLYFCMNEPPIEYKLYHWYGKDVVKVIKKTVAMLQSVMADKFHNSVNAPDK